LNYIGQDWGAENIVRNSAVQNKWKLGLGELA